MGRASHPGIHRGGKTAYVVSVGSDTVTPIFTATGTAGPAISVGSRTVAIAFTR
jgi:DNA-binding beta-propeller fold protein YncE